MKTKPWSLIILALLHVLAPLGNLILNALYSGRSLSQQWVYWFEVLPKPLMLIYVGVPILAGVFIYICRSWSYWAYLGCLAVILLSNIYSYLTSMNIDTLILLLVVLIVDFLVVAYFVVPSVQRVYFDPRMRWWEAAPRFHFNHAGMVNGSRAFIKSISLGGLFLSSAPDLSEGAVVDLSWSYEGQDVALKGEVVYKMSSGDMSGYGIRFQHAGESEKQLKTLVGKLRSEGLIIAERLPGPEDSFGSWLKKLVTRGEGLFPRMRV